jgi:hypothetical protein
VFIALVLSFDSESIERVVVETDEWFEVEHEVTQIKEVLDPFAMQLLVPYLLAEQVQIVSVVLQIDWYRVQVFLGVLLLYLELLNQEPNHLRLQVAFWVYCAVLKTLQYNQSLYPNPVFDLRISPLTVTLIILNHLYDYAFYASLIAINVPHHCLVQAVELDFLESDELLDVSKDQFDAIWIRLQLFVFVNEIILLLH